MKWPRTKEETNKQSGIFLMEYDMIPTLASKTEVPTPHPCHNRNILIRNQFDDQMETSKYHNSDISRIWCLDISWIITWMAFPKKTHHCFGKMLVKIPPLSRAFQPSNQMARRNPRSVCTVGTVTLVISLLALAVQNAAFCNLRQAQVGEQNLLQDGFSPNYYFRGWNYP